MEIKNNRIIRVFVSSTFADMNKERNYLMTKVFPRLKEIARRRYVTFVELDLRWGIRDEDVHNGKVLQSCLDAIRDSKPFFIGIVGNRYGWCPTAEELSKNPILLERYPEVLQDIDSGFSVTEIEMQYAVLRNPEKMHAYFYFRKHKEPLEEKIKQLRDKILKSKYPVSEYSDEVVFGEMVEKQFCELLDELYPEDSVPTTLYEHTAQIEHMKRISDGYKDYNYTENMLCSVAEDTTIKYWSLVGETGCGKSSLLADWVLNNSNKYCIIPCFIGSTHLDSSIVVIKNYLRKEINTTFGSSDSLEGSFEDALKKIPGDRNVIFVVDGLDNLTLPTEDVYAFLSSFSRFSQTSKVVFSLTNDSKVADQLHNLKAKYYKLKNLTEDRLFDIGTRYLKIYEKSLDEDKLQKIAEASICSNPLLFKAILNELIAAGTHETIGGLIEDYTESKTAEELFDKILVRYEKTYGLMLVSKSLSLLTSSQFGLTEQELIDLINPKPIEWSQFYYASSPFFSVMNGSLVIENNYLADAIKKRYINRECWAQETMLSYFKEKLEIEIDDLAEGKDAWEGRAKDIIIMELSGDRTTIKNYCEKIANHSDLLGRINRYVSLVANLSFITGNSELLFKTISSPLCYLSLEINQSILLTSYLQFLNRNDSDYVLLPLIDEKNYPDRIADLIFPDVCCRAGDRLKTIMHDTLNAEKAYEQAIEYWDCRGYSVTSDLNVIATYNKLISLYVNLQEYDKSDALFQKISDRFFAKKDWGAEYKVSVLFDYIISLENRGIIQNLDKYYDQALSFVSDITDKEQQLAQRAQILHIRGNYYAERALYENNSTYKQEYSNRSNECLCESIDILRDLCHNNPYKYHNLYLETRYDLANLHHDVGNQEVALSIFESIYSEFNDNQKEKSFDEFYIEDEILLHTMYSLSFMYNDMGSYDKAEEILNKVYKVREFQYSENALLFAKDMANCAYERARLYGRMRKDIKMVEYYYNKAIECYSKLNGELQLVARSYASMAFAYQREQMYNNAVESYKKSRDIWQSCVDNESQLPESRIAEIYFQEAQCSLACNDKDHFQDCMMKSFELYEKLSQKDPIYIKDLNRLADYMEDLLKANGLK